MSRKQVAVIGAGLGGMAVAARLAHLGHDVTVYESNSYVGGKAGEIRSSGYRFDAGPSVITMIDSFKELFHFCGEDIEQYVQFEQLDLLCRYFDGDRVIDLHRNEARSGGEPLTQNDEFIKYLDKLDARFSRIGDYVLNNDIRSLGSIFSVGFLKALLGAFTFNPLRTMHGENARSIDDASLVKIFDRFATYFGGDPYRASSMLNMIAPVEISHGSYIAKGGVRAIVDAIYQLSLRHGVKYMLETEVKEISDFGGDLTVAAKTSTSTYDLVISNLDRHLTESRLLKRSVAPIPPERLSSSAIVFYWGVLGNFPQLEQHNILFADDYAAEFSSLEQGDIYDDPTIYLYVSSKYQESDAPTDCENWFVMVNTPAGEMGSYVISKVRQIVRGKIEEHLGIDIENLIDFEHISTPQDFARSSGAYLGSLYGKSSNSMLDLLRPSNYDSKSDKIFYVGGTVHPGGGMPLVLNSARIIANSIMQQYGKDN